MSLLFEALAVDKIVNKIICLIALGSVTSARGYCVGRYICFFNTPVLTSYDFKQIYAPPIEAISMK